MPPTRPLAEVVESIPFNASMTLDKRAQGFAYLRHKWLTAKEKGLYPSADFNTLTSSLTAGWQIVAIEGVLVFVWDGTVTKVYQKSTTSLTFKYDIANRIVSVTAGSIKTLALAQDGSIYSVTTGSATAEASTGVTDLNGKLFYDGLKFFFIANAKIYSRLETSVAAPAVVFNDIGSGTVYGVDEYQNYIVLFVSMDLGIKVYFWDKADLNLYSKRILIKNCTFIAGGVIDGTLMLIKGTGNVQNIKEKQGEIQVTYYNGDYFEELNSIIAGFTQVNSTAYDIGNQIMVVALTSNVASSSQEYETKSELYKDWVLKIQKNGAIETMYYPDSSVKIVSAIHIEYDQISMGIRDLTSATAPIVLLNNDDGGTYTDYTDFSSDSVYISEFLTRPIEEKNLVYVGVSFEKLFNLEELEIWFRSSERENFRQICTVNTQFLVENINTQRELAEKEAELATDQGFSEYSAVFTMLEDGTPLGDFNEIQFKFVSRKGFSLTGAWFGANVIDRIATGINVI